MEGPSCAAASIACISKLKRGGFDRSNSSFVPRRLLLGAMYVTSSHFCSSLCHPTILYTSPLGPSCLNVTCSYIQTSIAMAVESTPALMIREIDLITTRPFNASVQPEAWRCLSPPVPLCTFCSERTRGGRSPPIDPMATNDKRPRTSYIVYRIGRVCTWYLV